MADGTSRGPSCLLRKGAAEPDTSAPRRGPCAAAGVERVRGHWELRWRKEDDHYALATQYILYRQWVAEKVS